MHRVSYVTAVVVTPFNLRLNLKLLLCDSLHGIATQKMRTLSISHIQARACKVVIRAGAMEDSSSHTKT